MSSWLDPERTHALRRIGVIFVAYSPSMPRLLFAGGLGALPILQMTILPPLIFKIASAIEPPNVDGY